MHQDGFKQSVASLESTLQTRVEEVDTFCMQRLDTFQEEEQQYQYRIQNLEREYDQKNHDKRMKIEQGIREFGLEKAREIAESHDHAIVSRKEYEGLKTRNVELERALTTQIEEITSQLQQKHSKDLEVQASTLQLEFYKKNAETEAKYQSMCGQLEVLKEQLLIAQKESIATRDLITQVAGARVSQPIVMHPSQNPSSNSSQ